MNKSIPHYKGANNTVCLTGEELPNEARNMDAEGGLGLRYRMVEKVARIFPSILVKLLANFAFQLLL